MTKIDNNFEQSNDRLVISTSANENGIVSVFNYNGNNVTFKTDDGIVYVNATQMAKPFGKQPSDWTRQKYYDEFISSLSAVRGIPITGLIITKQGGHDKQNQGTWMHEDVAIEFSRWLSPKFSIWCNDRIKELLTTGKVEITPKYSIPKEEIEVRKMEAKAKIAEMFMRIGDRTSIPEYKQILDSYAANILAERELLPLPEVNEKTYSATEIGKILGVSANKIGKLANQFNLKIPEFGKLFYDKSRYSNKEVETFRYYDKAINKFRELLK